MNSDQSDVMNSETTAVNNGTTGNNGTTADIGTRIPVPHGLDDLEVQEWLESLDSVLESSGPEVATEILERLRAHATVSGIDLPFTANTPYANTIPNRLEPLFPGDQELERRIKSLIRWNALAMVVRANRVEHNIGGHISTYASAGSTTSAATSPPTPPPPRFTKSASIISFARAAMTSKATPSTFRDTPRRAFMPAPSSKAASPRKS